MPPKRKVGFSEEVEVKTYEKQKRVKQDHDEEEAVAMDGIDAAHDSESEDEEGARERIVAGSDDEDDDEINSKAYQLTDADLHEDLDTTFTDGGIEVTPFNLNEEMEDGRFDEAGNYFEDKDATQGDEWLEGVQVYKGKHRLIEKMKENEEKEEQNINPLNIQREIVTLMQPGETVAKALRRLGGTGSSSNRWGKKNQAKDTPKADTAAFDKLTGLADDLLGAGEYNIYSDTYEKLAHLVKVEDERTKKESLRAKELEGTVQFHYKWKNQEGDELHGPYSAKEMHQWKEQGYFPDGVMCRQVGKDNFYDSKRIDFDDYI